jgi:hypothetical protein
MVAVLMVAVSSRRVTAGVPVGRPSVPISSGGSTVSAAVPFLVSELIEYAQT